MITSSKKDDIRFQHTFIFHFLINFYKYLREPFYHIKREVRRPFLASQAIGKVFFDWLANGKKIYIVSRLHPKTDTHYFKGSF